MSLSIPVVVGTTGWYERIDEVREIVLRTDGSLVYSPNFSLGVNIFFRIVKFAATQLSKFDDFDPYLFESHHRMKLDAPSGTALNLESILRSTLGDRAPNAVSLRAGFIPGSHEVGFDSTSETVRIVHSARNREPFA
ncbi:MAG: 4-hydroxy-tetrahydrodipicolinate reductase, partial [Acidobacteria bacterium]|nr:4-hydroxy-tetrahydrodipicolinate reductase [Acidobacteriota bacterium]